jgi:hypothetical protein
VSRRFAVPWLEQARRGTPGAFQHHPNIRAVHPW